jgi:hypothetical protein
VIHGSFLSAFICVRPRLLLFCASCAFLRLFCCSVFPLRLCVRFFFSLLQERHRFNLDPHFLSYLQL